MKKQDKLFTYLLLNFGMVALNMVFFPKETEAVLKLIAKTARECKHE